MFRAIGVMMFLTSAALAVSETPMSSLPTLQPGVREEGTISAGEAQTWNISLNPRDYVQICLQVHEIGLSLTLKKASSSSATAAVIATAPPSGAPLTCIRTIISSGGKYSV